MNTEIPPRITSAPIPIATASVPLNPLPLDVEVVVTVGATVGATPFEGTVV
jgi:hypothetical protein